MSEKETDVSNDNHRDHPINGLLHSPQPSGWDQETVLHAPDWRSRSGHTDGWHWATDTSTVCGLAVAVDDNDDTMTGHKAVEYLTAELSPPLHAVEPRDLAIIGGIGRLRDWGTWDLDRVADAASWVIGDEGERVIVAVGDGPSLTIVAPSGRVAVVMGLRHNEGEWYPTVDLPTTVAEASR